MRIQEDLPSRTGWDTLPVQDWMGYPPSRTGWGTPPCPRLDGVTPPPPSGDRSAKQALATQWAVCLLHSHRRTFLFHRYLSVHGVGGGEGGTPWPLVPGLFWGEVSLALWSQVLSWGYPVRSQARVTLFPPARIRTKVSSNPQPAPGQGYAPPQTAHTTDRIRHGRCASCGHAGLFG